MNEKFLLIGRGRIRGRSETFFDRKIREQRRDERRLAGQCTIKHHLLAKNSCVADARSYRIARRLPIKSFVIINQSAGQPRFAYAYENTDAATTKDCFA